MPRRTLLLFPQPIGSPYVVLVEISPWQVRRDDVPGVSEVVGLRPVLVLKLRWRRREIYRAADERDRLRRDASTLSFALSKK